MMPVAIVASEARRLQRKHGADRPFTDGREQPTEAWTRLPARAAHAEIVVNHDHAGKAHVACAIDEPVLPLLAFAVMTHLQQTRLPDIHRQPAQDDRHDFLVHSLLADASPEEPLAAVVPPARCTGAAPDPESSATVLVGRTSASVAMVDAR
jgi:hypothetical protein